jgi:hypothetical protein
MRVETTQRKLRLRMKDFINSSMDVPTYVLIVRFAFGPALSIQIFESLFQVYDGSASIHSADFAQELQCGLKIVNSFSPRVKMGAIVFSSSVTELAAFSSSRESLISAHHGSQPFSKSCLSNLILIVCRRHPACRKHFDA